MKLWLDRTKQSTLYRNLLNHNQLIVEIAIYFVFIYAEGARYWQKEIGFRTRPGLGLDPIGSGSRSLGSRVGSGSKDLSFFGFGFGYGSQKIRTRRSLLTIHINDHGS